MTTYDYTVFFEGYTGSSWTTIDFFTGSLAGQTSGVTQYFEIQDESGYEQFRLRVADRNTSGGTWQFNTYSHEQYVSEIIYNERGLNVVGGNFYMTDLPTNDNTAFNVDNLPSNTVFSDEKDANGNWILKLKV